MGWGNKRETPPPPGRPLLPPGIFSKSSKTNLGLGERRTIHTLMDRIYSTYFHISLHPPERVGGERRERERKRNREREREREEKRGTCWLLPTFLFLYQMSHHKHSKVVGPTKPSEERCGGGGGRGGEEGRGRNQVRSTYLPTYLPVNNGKKPPRSFCTCPVQPLLPPPPLLSRSLTISDIFSPLSRRPRSLPSFLTTDRPTDRPIGGDEIN